MMIKLLVYIKRRYSKIVEDYRFSSMAYTWRKMNRHNRTYAARFFPISNVTVGKHSYGMLDVRTYCKNAGELLQIGNYVSIADNVIFILGGQHQVKTFTTFPLRAFFTRVNNKRDSMSKGPIIVDDEVWLGFGSIILSGVKIGRGAIVGAGAVVVKDVPPYSIVAGNPATIIKYRFTKATIDKISEIRLSSISEKNILTNFDIFDEPVENNDSLIEKLKKLS